MSAGFDVVWVLGQWEGAKGTIGMNSRTTFVKRSKDNAMLIHRLLMHNVQAHIHRRRVSLV